jgi:hypothetical protein
MRTFDQPLWSRYHKQGINRRHFDEGEPEMKQMPGAAEFDASGNTGGWGSLVELFQPPAQAQPVFLFHFAAPVQS